MSVFIDLLVSLPNQQLLVLGWLALGNVLSVVSFEKGRKFLRNAWANYSSGILTTYELLLIDQQSEICNEGYIRGVNLRSQYISRSLGHGGI